MHVTSLKSGLLLCSFGTMSGCYLLKQGLSLNALMNTRVPTSQVVEEGLKSSHPEDIEEAKKIVDVEKMLRFAKARGLKTDDAYTYYIRLKTPQVSYIVQAAPWNSLSLKTWWFPIVGTVPYLGFYQLSEAQEEARILKEADYDVSIGGVTAFSSLGWFSDPLLSSMLLKTRDKIAETLFHELAHRTLWIAGDAEFNEQFAEFIGYQMAIDFLTEEKDALAIDQLKQRNDDEKAFSRWISDLRDELTQLYSGSQGQDKERILQQKALIISKHLQPPLKPKFLQYDYTARDNWNNASIMASALYQSNKKAWQEAYVCSQCKSLKDFILLLSQKIEKSPKALPAVLQSFCTNQGKPLL